MDALADGDAEPRMSRRIDFTMNRKPRINVRFLMQYAGKPYPARQSIAPRQSLYIFGVTRQDGHARAHDGRR